MKILSGYFLIVLFLLYSCETTDTRKTIKSTDTMDSALTAVSLQAPKPLIETWDSTTVIGEAVLWRKAKDDGSGNWESVLATNVFGFKKSIPLGALVQIIPQTKALPAITLEVLKVTKRDDAEEVWYQIELEEIRDSSYWNFQGSTDRRPEFPCELLVLYPPVTDCSILLGNEFDAADLPSGVGNELIKGALDFNGDGLPDALICTFCCKDRSPIGSCDNHCEEFYIKYDHKWSMINASQPL